MASAQGRRVALEIADSARGDPLLLGPRRRPTSRQCWKPQLGAAEGAPVARCTNARPSRSIKPQLHALRLAMAHRRDETCQPAQGLRCVHKTSCEDSWQSAAYPYLSGCCASWPCFCQITHDPRTETHMDRDGNKGPEGAANRANTSQPSRGVDERQRQSHLLVALLVRRPF